MFDPDALPVPDLGLRCKRCGYPLAHLNAHQCPECDRPFTLEEHLPSGDCPPLIAGGEEIRATRDVAVLLRVYQIPYVQLSDPAHGVLSSMLPDMSRQPPRIGVPRERYFEAVDLLRRERLDEPMPEPPTSTERVADWTCAHCDELNPRNFDICWNCNEPAPDLED